MKINGKKLDGPSVDYIVFPRMDGDIVFTISCVLDYDQFNELCPIPEPPKIQYRGSTDSVPNFKDPKFIESIEEFSQKRTHWMVLKSLEASSDLEWDTVNMMDSSTWGNYIDELTEGGFTDAQVAKIINSVSSLNGLNERMMEDAKKRFLAGKLVNNLQNSQEVEHPST